MSWLNIHLKEVKITRARARRLNRSTRLRKNIANSRTYANKLEKLRLRPRNAKGSTGSPEYAPQNRD